MSRMTRDGTAEPISRDQILRHARGQGNVIFPVQLTTSRIGNLTRLIHTLLYVMIIHTHDQRSQQQSGQITLQPGLITNSNFVKATHRTKIRKVEIPRSMVVEALSW